MGRSPVALAVAIALSVVLGAGVAGAHAAPGAAVPGIAAPGALATAVPTHIPTWAYDDGCNGGAGAPPSLVAAWVTYAESACGPDTAAFKALYDCPTGAPSACTPVAYLNPSWIYASGSAPVPWSEPESWWLHEPGVTPGRAAPGNRLRSTREGTGYVLNQTTAAVREWFAAYAQRALGRYPDLMMDDTGASLQSLLYETGAGGAPYTTSAEIPGDAALQRAHEQMAAALVHADGTPFVQIDNALTPNDNLPTPFAMLNQPASVRGLVAEDFPVDDGTLTPYYATLLDELAEVDDGAGTAGDFVVLLSYDPAGAIRARWLQEATVLLGESADQVVDWADLETGSRALAVWPEEGIVPADPVQSMSLPGGAGCLAGRGIVCTLGGHLDLHPAAAPAGVYVREFRDCFDRGVPVGACAAVVNDTPVVQTIEAGWLAQTYQWEMSVNVPAGTSGDVQSGGTVIPDGTGFSPGVSSVGPDSAVLLAGPATAPPSAASTTSPLAASFSWPGWNGPPG
ncbi:MAG: hypothetical protein ABSH51_06300 [Solirubrobacteraceae bacterium]